MAAKEDRVSLRDDENVLELVVKPLNCMLKMFFIAKNKKRSHPIKTG